MNSVNPSTPEVIPYGLPQTALPAFIGYTQKAASNGSSLLNTPTLVNSLAEYTLYFGGAPDFKFPIEDVPYQEDGSPPAQGTYDLTIGRHYLRIGKPTSGNFYLYNCIRLFYLNGGGPCYIVSVGNYTSPAQLKDLLNGLNLLLNIQYPKPTIIQVPDGLVLNFNDYSTLQQEMIAQAGALQDRLAMLDVYHGWEDLTTPVIPDFRNAIGVSYLSYAVAYYPWMQTSVTSSEEISFSNLDMVSSGPVPNSPTGNTYILVSDLIPGPPGGYPANNDYINLMNAVTRAANVLPPCAGMAGIYTTTDNTQGVWEAPANVNMIGVINPMVAISDAQQAGLNMDAITGKSINAIRSFYGRGPAIVWGARTLDGFNLDYCYIPVRRTAIMIQQAIANIISNVVFQPNNSVTWNMVNSSASSFLSSIWTQGGLWGASPSDAYHVEIGLGTTMTDEDIRNGIMRLSAQVSLVRPGEFIIFSFEQLMTGSGD